MISYHAKRAQRYNSAAQRPAAVQLPSSSILQLYARVAAVVVGAYFDRSLRCSTRLYATTLIGACDALPAYTPLPLAATASAASVKWHTEVKCKDRLNITLVLKRSLYSCSCWCAWYMISYHTKRAQRNNSAAQRPAAVRPPSSSLQLYARVVAVVVDGYFDQSLRCSTRLYATTSRCCCFCCSCQVTCRRKV